MTAARTRFRKHVQSSKQITSGTTTALHALPIAIGPTFASALVVAGVIAFHEGRLSNWILIRFFFAHLLRYVLTHPYL